VISSKQNNLSHLGVIRFLQRNGNETV